MPPIDSGRIVRTFTQQIDAPADRVFPLLCPVREAEWLEGWGESVEIIHTASGLAEKGCVFKTRPPGRPETVWMITRHDPGARVVEFCRVTTGLVATTLEIAVDARPDGSSAVRIAYTFTPLGPEGRAFVREHHSEARFRAEMTWWQDAMNHWLRSGALLRSTPPS